MRRFRSMWWFGVFSIVTVGPAAQKGVFLVFFFTCSYRELWQCESLQNLASTRGPVGMLRAWCLFCQLCRMLQNSDINEIGLLRCLLSHEVEWFCWVKAELHSKVFFYLMVKCCRGKLFLLWHLVPFYRNLLTYIVQLTLKTPERLRHFQVSNIPIVGN